MLTKTQPESLLPIVINIKSEGINIAVFAEASDRSEMREKQKQKKKDSVEPPVIQSKSRRPKGT